MYDFKVLTCGEKIKKIRNQFGFKQEDITCGEITRNLISILENNKAGLTQKVAKVLADGINNLCKERNIDFSVTEDYLLEDIISQAKKIANDYIEYISTLPRNEITSIDEKLKEIDVFLKSYNTQEKKSLLYRAIAKRFMESKMYSKSMDYYLRAYESSINIGATTNSLVGIGACCTYLSKYDEAIHYYELLLDLNHDIQPSYLARFNIALCNYRLKNFDESLKDLINLKEEFKIIPITSINECNIDNLIGLCFLKLKSFNKSLAIFKELLINPQSETDELLTLTNLADVYEEIKDFPKLQKTCFKIKDKILQNTDFMNSYEGDFYISLAKNLRCIGDIKTSKTLLLKSLECFKNGTSKICIEDIETVFSLLLSSFINDLDTTNIEYLKNEFFELVEKEMIPKGNLISLRFIKYYTYTKELDKIDNIVDFLVV